MAVWLYTLISVIIVSAISLIGILTLSIKEDKLRKVLIYIIAFSAGTLFGDAFLHLIPSIAKQGISLTLSISILSGFLIFFILEKFLHWQHCHGTITEKSHVHPFAYINLVGDTFHNFLDGIIIAATYLVSIPAGIATTIAVTLHEIPQEIGDFSILLHGGFSKLRALFLNFVTALTAILGALITLLLTNKISSLNTILTAVSAGGLLYIAGSDLIPELHKHSAKLHQILAQIFFFVLGIGVMALLLLLD